MSLSFNIECEFQRCEVEEEHTATEITKKEKKGAKHLPSDPTTSTRQQSVREESKEREAEEKVNRET